MTIHSGYAMSCDSSKYYRENLTELSSIKHPERVKYSNTNLPTNKSYIEYQITANPDDLTPIQLALFVSHGNLAFGWYGNERYITIYTD